MPSVGHADHVVDLNLAAGPDAEIAMDAGVELHRHGRMRIVGRGLMLERWEAAFRDAHAAGPGPELGSLHHGPPASSADRPAEAP